ncbi:MAG: hypothetical protein JO129_01480 [Candidatus Dependentiae bacterium]|nr:hypothetical protein [Candidatus Dependentiae bacterium]
MKKELLIKNLIHTAWKDFTKDWLTWVLLSFVGGLVWSALGVVVFYHVAESHHLFVRLFLLFASGFYAAVLYQNGLDAVFGRKLSLVKISPEIFTVSSIFSIAILSYNPYPVPQYTEFLSMLSMHNFHTAMAINWVIHLVIFYLLFRCVFVGMIILEEKISLVRAVKKSFKMTHHHIFSLLMILFLLALLLPLSIATVAGYFIALPFIVIMKCLLYKKLDGAKK